MTQWYVKELSKLTAISVQTLHHYDRIALLSPSIRLANGYRVYSEKDLLKLQQIIALKFFGFKLSQIKSLLSSEIDILEHFSMQAQALAEQAQHLCAASTTLKTIIADCSPSKSISWETILKLIEVYRMTKELEKNWLGKTLNPEELRQYAQFEQDFKARFQPAEQKTVEQAWVELMQEVGANLEQDPQSAYGIKLGQQCMDWVNQVYGRQYNSLRTAIWEKGFKTAQHSEEQNINPEAIAWLDKAIDAYYRQRIYSLLDQVEGEPTKEIFYAWEELLADMYSEQQTAKDELVKAALADERVSLSAKSWLKEYSKPKN